MKLLNCLTTYLAVVCFATAVASCGKADKEGGKPVLTVSLEPQRYMLEQIVGDNFKVVTLMPNGENPETFDPSPARRMDVDNSEAYFMVGYLPFEDKLRSTAKDTSIFVNTTSAIDPIYGTHGCCRAHSKDVHGKAGDAMSADPHLWTSVRNARVMTAVMAHRVAEIDPDNAQLYLSRLAKFDAHLDSLDRSFAERLAAMPDKAFLVWHPSLSYFARDYGLEQLAVGHESKEVSVNGLREIVDEAKSDSVKVFFYQRDYDSRQAEVVSAGTGARLVPVNPGGYEWEKELNNIVDELLRP